MGAIAVTDNTCMGAAQTQLITLLRWRSCACAVHAGAPERARRPGRCRFICGVLRPRPRLLVRRECTSATYNAALKDAKTIFVTERKTRRSRIGTRKHESEKLALLATSRQAQSSQSHRQHKNTSTAPIGAPAREASQRLVSSGRCARTTVKQPLQARREARES